LLHGAKVFSPFCRQALAFHTLPSLLVYIFDEL
jgi:hypothetical protein